MDLRSTLQLPDAESTIPMKANLPALEPSILAIWEERDLYAQILASRDGAPSYVLHDGPPYTNSPIHLGTALNKILKDFTVKSRTMMGYRAPYVPGFDSHGLPIELAVTKKLAAKKETVTGSALRTACREHAYEYIKIQSEQFERLGVLGLWKHPYATLDYTYEAELVRTFKKLVEARHIYKGLRPTLWSPTSQTALADTEIVYHDHVSTSIYVRFALRDDPNQIFSEFKNLYTIIWTTTPWTIPANLAVAFHPQLDYAIVKVGEDHYLIVSALVARVAEKLGWTEFEIVATREGINFDHATFSHPIFDRPSVVVMAEYVTTEDGTGVVHTAPSHGRDDFYTGQKYGLPVPNTVDGKGVLTAEAGEFAGTYYKDCDTVVVDRLKEVGALLKSEPYHHTYPYAERDGKPVIFRATEQWFLSIDPIREQMLEEIQGVQWVPPVGQNRIEAMVRNRPDWCISRQRPWGVGIPVFYGKESRVPVLDPEAIEAVARLVEERGSDAWFEVDAKDILPDGYVHPETGETEFDKETDTLDVWFDSGSSSLVTLDSQVTPEWKTQGLHWPADVYFEGSDQHRGWFNTSLILGTAIKGAAPYRTVVTHGFVTDSEGRKMSKSLGNVIEPMAAANQYGADILRYWVASVDYQSDVPCSDALLKQIGDSYRNVRNTLRFLLSSAAGYDATSEGPTTEGSWPELDEWIREQADLLAADCAQKYEAFDFGGVINAIHNFCREELSKFYLDAIKDRMYCDGVNWPSRRSGQGTCLYVLNQLLTLVAPILAFTAEETWMKMRELGLNASEQSIHTERFRTPTLERLQEIEGSPLQARFESLRGLRDTVNAAFEQYKGTDGIKNSQDAIVRLALPADTFGVMSSFSIDDLANYFRVSWVDLTLGEPAISFAPSSYPECARSRLRRPDVTSISIEREEFLLSDRDRQVLGV